MRNLSRLSWAAFICASLLLAACSQQLPAWHSGKLVIITLENEQGAEIELERELMELFAAQIHAEIEVIPLPQDQVYSALFNHRAHFAAASLRSAIDSSQLEYGPSYLNVPELLVCKRDGKKLISLDDLKGNAFSVLAGSAQEVAVLEAQKLSPGLQWQTRHRLTAIDLLAEVAEGTLDCAVANKLQFDEARNYHPNLVAALEVSTPSKLAWGFPKNVDPELLNQAQIFFAKIKQDGTLNRLLERYYGHNNRLDRQDAATFITRIETVLPRYRRLFKEAAALTGEDWRLLAALAYQESQWDPLATSFTNVRGMMMLTEDTADRMNLSNRLDARESIIAGAKYLALLKEQMPNRIPEPDRTWLALAAYNQGYGHLEDARILTKRAGLNPDSWLDIKKHMPLLSQPVYFKTLKRGYARGGEAVILVENIRNYYDMLKRLESESTAVDFMGTTFQLPKHVNNSR